MDISQSCGLFSANLPLLCYLLYNLLQLNKKNVCGVNCTGNCVFHVLKATIYKSMKRLGQCTITNVMYFALR